MHIEVNMMICDQDTDLVPEHNFSVAIKSLDSVDSPPSVLLYHAACSKTTQS